MGSPVGSQRGATRVGVSSPLESDSLRRLHHTIRAFQELLHYMTRLASSPVDGQRDYATNLISTARPLTPSHTHSHPLTLPTQHELPPDGGGGPAMWQAMPSTRRSFWMSSQKS
jgi:hypothetical protein